MNNPQLRGRGAPAKARAAHDRDATLVRLSRTRRWLAGGAAALTAAFAALVSTITPGQTAAASSHSHTAGTAGTRTAAVAGPRRKMPPLASASALGLQAAASAPQSAPTLAQSGSNPSQSAPASSSATPAPAASAPAAVSGGS